MYELNRVRLVGIGPRGARYTDVTIDLSGVGDPVSSGRLFDEAHHRPSPWSLLMLENGGGKSVLLKLLFSVVLPGRRKTVGGASLDKFILETDVGHVALEWMHVQTGDRLVTAKVSQRRAVTAGNTNPLAEAWYTFRPSDSLDLAGLPVMAEGRRQKIEAYRKAVEEADREQPSTQMSWMGDEQKTWRTHLRSLGIEPDLYDIQRSMNVDEGEAAHAFKFSSSKGFVDWLLTTVTDPADSRSVEETFEQWATTVADRDRMLLERDFLDGTTIRLDELAGGHAVHEAARRTRATARQKATQLADLVAARHADAEQLAEELGQASSDARTQVQTSVMGTRAAREEANEIRLQTLRLELADATRTSEQRRADLDAIELQLHGWNTVNLIEERAAADAAAQSLAHQVQQADATAAPALRRRDEAAGRLLAKLEYEAQASMTAALRDAEAAADHRRRADTADTAGEAVALELNTACERHRVALASVEEATAALAGAAEQQLVPTGTDAASLQRLLDQAGHDHEAGTARLTEARAVVVATADVLATAEGGEDRTRKAVEQARRLAERAADLHTAATESALRVSVLDSIAQAAGGTEADDTESLSVEELDRSADTLLGVLGADRDHHTASLAAATALWSEDDRLLQALGNGGLLPARDEVGRAVDTLTAAGISAHPGWSYLRDTAAASERSRLIQAHPHLADGVVLVDANQLDLARSVLDAAQLLPVAAVAVDAGAALLDPSASTGGFVVDPTPALYDEDAAAVRRAELGSEMAAHSQVIQRLTAQLDDTHAAYTELSLWRRANPPGHLTTLREESARLAGLSDTADADHRTAEAELADLTENHRSALSDRETAGAVERTASDRVAALVTLERQVSRAAASGAGLPALQETIQRSSLQKEEKKAERQRHLDTSMELTTAAANHRNQSERHKTEARQVLSTSGTPAQTVPAEPVSQLRTAAEATQATYLAVATSPDLRHDAEQAAEKARAARETLLLRDPAHVTEGERLLTTPEGANRTSWAVAIGGARRRQTLLTAETAKLAQQIGGLGQAVAGAKPAEEGRLSWTSLPPELTPTSVSHGRELQRGAIDRWNQAQVVLNDANAHLSDVEEQRTAVDADRTRFYEAWLPLATLLAIDSITVAPTAVPFDGTGEDAARQAAAAVTADRQSAQTVEVARDRVHEAVTALTTFANTDRFETMANPVRRAILDSQPSLLAVNAGRWAGDLRARQASLTSDLENATKYRKTIIDRLTALVDQALTTLRQAAKLSKLPADLGDWAGRRFLRISFAETNVAAISVRVSEVVDRVADEYSSRSAGSLVSSRKRDGIALLLEAVHAAVPRGFRVDVLKPDSVLRDERVSIEEMGEVFSGGQELTAAIVLYCTLAALRANERGQMRSKHSGVLFLDNPIGRASASYLIDLQQSVARSLGVQLVYTTGLMDDRVLAAFPLWVRMRNDADLRAGLKHIRVAEVVRAHLPAGYNEDLAGASAAAAEAEVSSTRVYRRSPAAAADGGQP